MKLWLFVIVCYVPASFSVLPCGYTHWSCWSDCDASCGDKVQSRERSCTNPPPSLPGYDCSGLGPSIEVRQCYGPTDQIDVDGGYNNWGLWSECTKDCGGGIQYRTRWCVDPHPQGKGKECSEQKELGPAVKRRSCNEHDCNEEPTEEPTTEESTEGPTIEEESPETPTTEESSEEPTTEESTETPTTEESSGEPTAEESTEGPTIEEESSGEPTTEETTETPTTEESSGAPTTKERTEGPTTEEESSGEPIIEETTETPTTEESSGEPTTKESTEGPTTEESSGETTTEESTEGPTTEESSGEPATEESTEGPTTEESSGETTTEESTEGPTTEESSGEPTTEESTEGPTTEESSGEPTTEESTEGPTIEEESSGETTTEESTEGPTTEESSEETTTEESTEGPTTEESSGETTTEESTEGPTTVESSGETTTEESTEGPTTEESSGETTEESTEGPTTEESSGETTEESTEGPTTEESSGETTTEESTEGKTTEESSGETTTEESTEGPTTVESSGETTTEESTEGPTTEESSGETTEESTETPTTEESSGETTTEESTEIPVTEESSEEPTTEESAEAPTAEESTKALTTEELTEALTKPTPTPEETTETPTAEEPATGAPCIKALDLGIIIDKSKSVKTRNLRKLKQSLVSFLHLFEVSAEGTHVGMISFNNDAELLFNFKDDRYYAEDQLRERVEEIPLQLEFQTRTDLALSLAKEKLFSVEGGDRPDVPNVCLVFTDGKSTGKPNQEGFVEIPKIVKDLTVDKEVHMIAVGIGAHIKDTELKTLAGDKGDYLHPKSFDELSKILEQLKDATCESTEAPTTAEESTKALTTEEFTEALTKPTPTPEEKTEPPTTEEKAEPPTTEEPETGEPCIKALDLGIIIDKSKSVKTRNLRKLKRSLVSFLHLFEVSAEGTHVGIISFNNDAELLFNFKDVRYHTEDQLRERVEEIPLQLEFQTRTDLALSLAKEKLFSVEGGDRPDVPNVCLVFTDGKSTGKPNQEGFVEIPKIVKDLTVDKEVHMIAVGIGAHIKDTELKTLAGDKGDYLHPKSFDELSKILEQLKDATCADAETGHSYYPQSFERRFKNVPGGLLDDRRMR